ncbi:MAG TPA: hypothetical protein VER33_04730 [Polyangiaceae bacterium]|nr:hypothetical protein [Polyangiaceae bacterium]
MSIFARIRHPGWLWLITSLLLVPPSPANAAPGSPIVLGRIDTRPSREAAVQQLLRSSIQEELAAADFGRSGAGKRYVLSARLLKLENAVQGHSVSSTCVISVLLESQQQVLVAVIRGRATAQDDSGNAAKARAAAVRGAVRSAISRVAPALAASEPAS